jgi:hypothetical protein
MVDMSHGLLDAGVGFPASTPEVGIGASLPRFDSAGDELLRQRYGRRLKQKQDLVYEFTRDPGLIHQYHLIYEEQFRAVHSADRYRHTEEDEHDRRGHFVVVRRGNFCAGGARISIKTPRHNHLLPVEMDGFRLEHYFPQLAQKQMRYGQAGRFCLLPEFRGGDITRDLQRRITRKAVAWGLDMFFATAPLTNARVYKQNCLAIGFKEVKVHFDIELPVYPMCEDVKFYLISGVIDKELANSVKSQPDFIQEEQVDHGEETV